MARKPPASPPPTEPPSKPAAAARKRSTAARPAGKSVAKLAVTTPPQPGTPRKKASVAGPKPRATRPAREKAEPSRLDQLQQIIMSSLEDDKAEQVVALDLAGRASFADRMVIATGLADRQIAAMATHLEDKLQEAGLKRVQIEGANGSDWVLIDAGDIVIHLFKPESRTLYGLERMWGADLDEPTPPSTPTPAA